MRRHPKRAAVDPTSPRAWATDDRSGFVGNHENLRPQFQWAGTRLVNTGILVYQDQLDVPQEQLRAVILPVDPPSIVSARPEPYYIDEYTQRREEDGTVRYQMDGTARILSNAQSGNSQ